MTRPIPTASTTSPPGELSSTVTNGTPLIRAVALRLTRPIAASNAARSPLWIAERISILAEPPSAPSSTTVTPASAPGPVRPASRSAPSAHRNLKQRPIRPHHLTPDNLDRYRSRLHQALVELPDRIFAAHLAPPVLAQLQDLELAQRIIKIRRIGRSAKGFLTRDLRRLVGLLN